MGRRKLRLIGVKQWQDRKLRNMTCSNANWIRKYRRLLQSSVKRPGGQRLQPWNGLWSSILKNTKRLENHNNPLISQ